MLSTWQASTSSAGAAYLPQDEAAATHGARLREATHSTPHDFLGKHLGGTGSQNGVIVRAYHPAAQACTLVSATKRWPMQAADGVFCVLLTEASIDLAYKLEYSFADGTLWTCEDPYRFGPTVGQLDQHLFNEGRHYRLYDVLGAHPRRLDGVRGVSFAVWAPNAQRVSVVGDFCGWDGRRLPMRALGSSGIFELFVPELAVGAVYKYEVRGANGAVALKTDPFAQAMELPPKTASLVTQSEFSWQDAAYMEAHAQMEPRRRPLAIYEVHLGSWAHQVEEGGRSLTYRELAPRLVAHLQRYGFNALELLPVAEHPFSGSWGYQVSGYFAPTSRYGTPDDLRYFVDYCHRHEIAVLVDWVPAHFPKDAFALAQFDGTALYEHADPRRGEHPDWGTLIFNYGRNEVRNFLVANALFWLREFHLDGLRVDAVASMLYLDYSREADAWLPNVHGGRENLEAVAFLRELNGVVQEQRPGALMIAEESTAWPGVTYPLHDGGLGFTFKWNMGWMHDTLAYFLEDPINRSHHQDRLSFAMVYEYTEAFVMPLSHDEVVHGKGTLLRKMPGDPWQKFANLRLLLAYQYMRPGKKLLFMGAELAPDAEWNHDRSLDWHLEADPMRQGLGRLLESLGRFYLRTPALWQDDHQPSGFRWIDHADKDQSVMAFCRQTEVDGRTQEVLVVLNFTPVPRPSYRIGAPSAGSWGIVLSTDDAHFGGSGCENRPIQASEPVAWHGCAQSVILTLPPLGALILTQDRPL
jgi:1,4-alpha-glucan branching enzyme